MYKKKLILVDIFDSEFKGQKYTIYKFFDTDCGQYFNGTNLNKKLSVGKIYVCILDYKKGKIKVTDVEE